MIALKKNQTWEIVDLPKGKMPNRKWIFTVKYKSYGSLERYKVRLVTKGYTQTYDIDYHKTFAPVTKMNTVKILLSLAAIKAWSLNQFDLKNAFLHRDLEDEVYMGIPLGYEETWQKNQVGRLKKSLYGLKQSPLAWFERFTKSMLDRGYSQSQGNHTLSSIEKVTGLIVYVDDIIVIGDDHEGILELKVYLEKKNWN